MQKTHINILHGSMACFIDAETVGIMTGFSKRLRGREALPSNGQRQRLWLHPRGLNRRLRQDMPPSSLAHSLLPTSRTA